LRFAVQTAFGWVSASAISLLVERDRVPAGEEMGRGLSLRKFVEKIILNFACQCFD
jgi:hypothetical protein